MHDHEHEHEHEHATIPAPSVQPSPRMPVRYEASGESGRAAGWVFSKEDIFKVNVVRLPLLMTTMDVQARDELLAFIQLVWRCAARVKGVFRIGKALALAVDIGCERRSKVKKHRVEQNEAKSIELK
eukprot:scaffold57458_cov31-Prasinocladus_malaysianus.AAC.1